MTEILSNLLGEIVEVTSVEYEGGKTHTYVNARGMVRALYPMERSGMCIVVENDRQEPVGRLLGYDMYVHAVRLVRQCELCGQWDHPSTLGPGPMADGTTDPTTLAHKKFHKGCREKG